MRQTLCLSLLVALHFSHCHAFSSSRQLRLSPVEKLAPFSAHHGHCPTLSLSRRRRNLNRLWETNSGENNDSLEETEDIPPVVPESLSLPSQTGVVAEEVADTASSVSKLPSYKELILFTGTTILIWISEPLLSLVDTTIVGITQKNAVVQVAALGPATTLIDSLQYLTYFLAMATTTEIAKYLALDDYRKLQQTTSQILGVAGLLGLLITAIVYGLGYPMLKAMIGTSQSPELVGLAARYCWIRASVAPLAVMGMVAETNCLANVDTRTPAIAVMTASIVNVIGDIGLSFWGMQGAAIATAVATATSATIMLRRVKKRKDMWRQKELEQNDNNNALLGTNGAGNDRSSIVDASPTMNTMSINGEKSKDETPISSASKVKDSSAERVPFLSLPDRASFIDLLKLSGPMFFVMLGKIACYSAMSIRATDFGVVNLAAHSIMMRVYFFFTCFGDSLSQATQSFLPKALYPKPVPKDLRKMLKRFFIFSTFVGLFIAQSSSWILNNFGQYLTNDKTVVATIARHTKLMSLSLLLHPYLMLTEGTLIATRDFSNLISSYTVTMAMHFGLLALACTAFRDIWQVLFLFQAVRVTLFSTRVIRKVVLKRQPEPQPQTA